MHGEHQNQHHDGNRPTRRTALLAAASIAASPSVISAARGRPAIDDSSHDNSSPEPWLTPPDDFRDVSRGRPKPHKLSDEQKVAVGLTRETWQLNVVADREAEPKAIIGQPLSQELQTAFRFSDLMQLAKTKAVRFPKVMTCLNIGCPLGMGIWEGVPLRDVIWKTRPVENIRRVFFYGYHNDDPEQRFQSSLPLGRVLEDPYDLPPVILCYKLNGEWLSSERGGPVRIVVPEAYGFKSIKWLTDVVLTNLSHANDTYANGNNDLDSPLKTFATTIQVPDTVAAGQHFSVSGYAQVGISGLTGVEVWVSPIDQKWPQDDPYFENAPWKAARVLPLPEDWGDTPDTMIPEDTQGFDASGRPLAWPMRLCKAFWKIELPGLSEGQYRLRCRSIDENGVAQPMPRPFRKSGHATIESVRFRVEG